MGVLAKGTNSVEAYSVPKEAEKVFKDGLLENPLVSKDLPAGFEKYAGKIKFEGSDFPSIPVNWRFAESISALKGLEALFVQALLDKKYNVPPQEIIIDTDHASLFIMSSLLWRFDPHSQKPVTAGDQATPKYDSYFRNFDIHQSLGTMFSILTTNIYKTKDNRYFHLHASLNAKPSQESLGLTPPSSPATYDEALPIFVNAMSKITSEEMQILATEKFRQAGTICYSTEEYKASEHGKANSHVGLYEIYSKPSPSQPASWWPDSSSPKTSAERPLAGLKVVDLTRIIAAPAVTRGLAELGASVMRITAEHLPDFSQLHPDLNWGKWNAFLDLREEGDREKLRALVLEADVVVSGYRPGIMEKYGFGPEDILRLCKGRERGIIVAKENCYGWHGPWAGRSGWQQISDANVGVSFEFGRAMGNDEPVTPIFPNSDYCTGVAGICGVLDAIIRRGEKGGSYQVDIALNYYSQWLVNSVGTYPPEIWDKLWTSNGRTVFRHYDGMHRLLLPTMATMMKNNAAKLFKPNYFVEVPAKALGTTARIVAPVLKFPDGRVKLGFNVGTRGNGVDQPRWPEDLMTETVR